MNSVLDGLNDAQRTAVVSPASVLQVLAPPGSGKTKTLTARVANLIANRGLAPCNIIVCTFTVKAAREMKERIRGLIGDGVESQLILGTFHSVARRYLVAYGHHVGIPKNFGIADSQDSLSILKRIIKRRRCNFEPSAARSRISALKARGVTADQYASTKSTEKQEFALIYADYEDALHISNLLDYDDLLLRCVDLLREHAECVVNIEAVLIDEFQDTNNVQYELMCLFAQHRKSITIVGDPDQSIYGFRSAEIKNLVRMQQQYVETVVVTLEENYRSSGSILLSALDVIEQDESRPAKKLLATHCVGERPVLRLLPSAQVEAEWIVSEIRRCMSLTGNLFSRKDFAILLRSASLSRHIESALGKAGMPYRMVGGLKFFDRAEVKIVLDYLRVINLPDHSDALLRILNVPPRKIGDTTVKHLIHEAESRRVTLWSIVLQIAQGNLKPATKLSTQAEKGLEAFTNVIMTSRTKISQCESPVPLIDFIQDLLKRLRFEEFLKKNYPAEEFETRWSNVQELVTQASDPSLMTDAENLIPGGELPATGEEQTENMASEDLLARFLANVALSTEIERQNDADASTEQVTVSTTHAAKGLEWPVVFIPAAFEGSIPHSRAEDTSEERRLLYVGMTRAQSLLYITCPVTNSQGEQTKLSQFLPLKCTRRWFRKRGPSFQLSLIQDLARILRRSCPSQIKIFETSRHEAAEDDYWPSDGERPDKSETKYRNGEREGFSGHYPESRKRRKIEMGGSITTSSIETTMQRRDAYSVANATLSVGFVSASVQLKEQNGQTANAVPNPHNLQSTDSASVSLEKRRSNQPLNKGNILAFFGTERVTHVGNLPNTKLEKVHCGPNRERISNSKPDRTPLQPMPNVTSRQCVKTKPITSALLANSKSHAAVPAPQARRTTQSSAEENETYVFLSISPVKPQDDTPKGGTTSYRSQYPDIQGVTILSTPVLAPKPTRLGLGECGSAEIALSRPTDSGLAAREEANADHSRSAAIGVSKNLSQRRSLGMRRTFQGWSSGLNKPFTAPGRAR